MLLTRSSRDYMTSHANLYFRCFVETCTPKWLGKCSIEAMHSWMIYMKYSTRMTIWQDEFRERMQRWTLKLRASTEFVSLKWEMWQRTNDVRRVWICAYT